MKYILFSLIIFFLIFSLIEINKLCNECEKYSYANNNNLLVSPPSQFITIRKIRINNFLKCIILIPICSNNIYKRQAIRKTWAKRMNKIKFKIIFFMGCSDNKIDKEDDIIQFSFRDSYYNLTISTLLIYYWTNKVKKYFDYILKVDSDVYPNIPLINLFICVCINKGNNKIIFGYFYPEMKTNRNINNSNYLPNVIYQSSVIPEFVAGNFYIFPKFKEWDYFVKSINLTSKNLIYREDIQLGLYIKKNNIQIKRINYYYKRKIKFNTCKDYKLHLALHGIDTGKMFYINKNCF